VILLFLLPRGVRYLRLDIPALSAKVLREQFVAERQLAVHSEQERVRVRKSAHIGMLEKLRTWSDARTEEYVRLLSDEISLIPNLPDQG
jgi:hypothetical protein